MGEYLFFHSWLYNSCLSARIRGKTFFVALKGISLCAWDFKQAASASTPTLPATLRLHLQRGSAWSVAFLR